MDDSCAVCADTLEWVAYGPCGHREVCSTCVARLRFICDDRRCCICKTESNVIFVTKALGDYTRMINDFSVLPTEVKEGRVGSYWFHEDTQAYFDDVDHYKMIKAMCRLSCSVCDKMEEQPNGGSRRRAKFRSVEQLKGHLFHQHRQLMCSLCLEGRKVFICEQKLYTRTQLNQHVNTGDSEVDGTESERGGFMGHPMCEFCRTPFYGDNELYSHMSTEHYTCHICQRQNPGQFEYYKNYDDLEIHFRRDHFLCEDESCLAKKFVVFQSEAEMKRHNTLEHGGRMPRYKRNAALQIPTSFRYHRSSEQENRRGRGRGRTFHRDSADDTQLSLAIEASLETANTRHYNDPSISGHVSDRAETSDIGPIIQPFESLDVTDSELPSRYREALSLSSRNTPIQESFFPPLSMSSGSSSSTSQQKEGLPKNTMAERLRRKNQKNVTVLNSAQAWPAAAGVQRPVQPPAINPAHFRPLTNSPVQIKQPLTETRPPPPPPSYSNFLQVRPASAAGSSSSSRSVGSTGRTSPQNASFDPPLSDFPPVSASGRIVPKVEDVQTANKSLVERMRTALEFDEIKYSTFKDISGQYRQGQIDTETYYVCVEEFGLSHLVPELARLCPDAQKQKELIQTHNARSLSNGPNENGGGSSISSHSSVVWKVGNGSKKGKGKSSLNAESSIPKDNSADSFLSTIKKLQSSLNDVSGEEVEVLRKDGYRSAKGKSKVMIDDSPVELSSNDPSLKLKGPIESQSSADGDGRGKQKKKTSKFHRVRLGDGSIASVLDLKNSDRVPEPDPDLRESALEKNPNEGLPARGVWRNSGGQRLLGNAPKEPRK